MVDRIPKGKQNKSRILVSPHPHLEPTTKGVITHSLISTSYFDMILNNSVVVGINALPRPFILIDYFYYIVIEWHICSWN